MDFQEGNGDFLLGALGAAQLQLVAQPGFDDLADAPGGEIVTAGQGGVIGAVAVGAADLLVSHLVGQVLQGRHRDAAATVNGENSEGVGYAPRLEIVQRETAGDDALHTVHGRRCQALAGMLGAQGDGGIQGDAAAVRFLEFQAGNEAVVNRLIKECGAGRQRLWLQLQAQVGRFAQDVGYGFTGWNFGCLGHGRLHSPKVVGSRVRTGCKWRRADAMDRAPSAVSAQAAAGGAAAEALARAIEAAPNP